MPRGVAAKLAYQQVGKEALRRARTVLRRAADSGAKLDGQAYSALCTAHAAMGSNQEAASLALEAGVRQGGAQPRLLLSARPRTTRPLSACAMMAEHPQTPHKPLTAHLCPRCT